MFGATRWLVVCYGREAKAPADREHGDSQDSVSDGFAPSPVSSKNSDAAGTWNELLATT
jgi:hypothetical protein